DTIEEPTEFFNINLLNSKNASVPGGVGKCFIVNNDFAGQLEFGLSSYTAGEADGVATITVKRTGGNASGVKVNYTTGSGSATAGVDYTDASGMLEFGFGESSKSFTIPITNDTIDEDNETVNLLISDPDTSSTLGTATLTIQDNDNGGNVQFGASSYD